MSKSVLTSIVRRGVCACVCQCVGSVLYICAYICFPTWTAALNLSRLRKFAWGCKCLNELNRTLNRLHPVSSIVHSLCNIRLSPYVKGVGHCPENTKQGSGRADAVSAMHTPAPAQRAAAYSHTLPPAHRSQAPSFTSKDETDTDNLLMYATCVKGQNHVYAIHKYKQNTRGVSWTMTLCQ